MFSAGILTNSTSYFIGGDLVTKSCLTLATPWTEEPRVCSPWDSPGRNTGMGCHSLLQGIYPSQALNPGLLHCRQILYHVRHKGSLS